MSGIGGSDGNSGEFDLRQGVEFARHDGVALAGDLYTPHGDGPFPALIAVHGGGWQQGGTFAYAHWGPWLAARGYVVFAVTYRFSAPGKKSFPECLHDVRAAVQFARGRALALKIDPDRIAMIGDSAGGHLASMVALAGDAAQFAGAYPADEFAGVSTRVKVVIPVYGVFDLLAQWQHDVGERTRDPITEKLLGVSAIDDKHTYFAASPLAWVSGKNNGTAFLVAWGTRDDIVDCREQSEVFLRALKQAGYFARPVVLEGAPHFWMVDPVDEPGSHNGFLAPRLLRFLQLRL